MKKILILSLILVLSLSLLTGCGSKPSETEQPSDTDKKVEEQKDAADKEPVNVGKLEDGIYFAQEDGFAESGWKYVVTLKVEGGKIIEAQWNGAHKDGGPDKVTVSESGDYGMVANGGAQAEWHEQAAKAEAFLLEKQDPTAITYTDDEGHTDAISGVSIHVVEFFDLAQKALANGPVGSGQYKDGNYYAEQDSFDENSGWKYTASLTVINGYIVAADWDGIYKDGGDNKDTISESGEYGMVEKGGAQAEWHEQADKAEAFLLEKQDPTSITYTDDEGHTDAISGVSIHVIEFFDLAQKALADAK